MIADKVKLLFRSGARCLYFGDNDVEGADDGIPRISLEDFLVRSAIEVGKDLLTPFDLGVQVRAAVGLYPALFVVNSYVFERSGTAKEALAEMDQIGVTDYRYRVVFSNAHSQQKIWSWWHERYHDRELVGMVQGHDQTFIAPVNRGERLVQLYLGMRPLGSPDVELPS